MAGAIDVIGGGNLSSRRPESGISSPAPASASNVDESTEHATEGATEKGSGASRAPDFSRPPPGFPNMALPPPFVPPPTLPPPLVSLAIPPPLMVSDAYGTSEFGLGGPGAPGDDYYQYEPTQNSQWSAAVRISRCLQSCVTNFACSFNGGFFIHFKSNDTWPNYQYQILIVVAPSIWSFDWLASGQCFLRKTPFRSYKPKALLYLSSPLLFMETPPP